MKKIKLTIEGMHCASCATNIERAIGKIKGVKGVTISLMMNKGFVEAEDNVDEKEIQKAVEKVGYKVVKMEKE